MLDGLITTEKRLEQAFAAKSTASQNRSFLFGPGAGNTSVNPWLAGEETDDTRAVTTYDIRQQHQQVLRGKSNKRSQLFDPVTDCQSINQSVSQG